MSYVRYLASAGIFALSIASAWAQDGSAPVLPGVPKSLVELRENLGQEDRQTLNLEMQENEIDPVVLENTEVHFVNGDVRLERDPALPVLSRKQSVYLGIRFGSIYLAGVSATYLNQRAPVGFHVDAEFNSNLANIDISTKYMMKAVTLGVGIHPWHKSFYVGARAHHLMFPLPMGPNPTHVSVNGLGPEIGFVGGKNRVTFSVRAGLMYFQADDGMAYTYDASAGIAFRLFKTH